MSNVTSINKVFGISDCVLPPIATQVVRSDAGVVLGRHLYCSPHLYPFVGQEVMLFQLDRATLGVCLGSEFICSLRETGWRRLSVGFDCGDRVRVAGLNHAGVVMRSTGAAGDKPSLCLVRLDGEVMLTPVGSDELVAEWAS